jgi:asparagine synthase (glutamine-hydrolysing)
MISDKPIGAFLSGGIDSTSVVAAMKEISARPIETFVISLGGRSEDMKYAEIAAKYFKTNHHELELKDINLETALMELVEQYDEPFFDQSALPSLLINKAVKKHVTVVLSGDGGDELFGGYESYGFAKFLDKYSTVPGGLKKVFEFLFRNSPHNQYKLEMINQGFFRAYSDYYSLWKTNLGKSKFYQTKNDLYLTKLKKDVSIDNASLKMKEWFSGDNDIMNRAMLADIRSRLPDGYLAKVDFASLRNAVEVRPPFLDYRLVELSQSIPGNLKINRRGVKLIWKKTVKDKIPAEIINRPKAGFGIPLHKILLNELKPVVENVLFSSSANIYHYFLKDSVEKIWKDHKNGKADYSNHIWSLLILELWIRRYQVK